MTEPLCQLCREPFAANPIGRPKVFCSPECRRELPRLRRHLEDLEGQLAEARYQRDQHKGAWRDHYARQVAWLIPRVEAARHRIPEDARCLT